MPTAGAAVIVDGGFDIKNRILILRGKAAGALECGLADFRMAPAYGFFLMV